MSEFQLRPSAVAWGLLVIPLLSGCSTSKAFIQTRTNSKYIVSKKISITLAEHPAPRPAEAALRADLLNELTREGFLLVTPGEAQFTLAFWIDESWKHGKQRVYETAHGDVWDTAGPRFGQAFPSPYNMFEDDFVVGHRIVRTDYFIQGIRLKLFPGVKHAPGGNALETVWEGYAEGGSKVSAKQQPLLLRALLNQIGRDFTGRVALAN